MTEAKNTFLYVTFGAVLFLLLINFWKSPPYKSPLVIGDCSIEPDTTAFDAVTASAPQRRTKYLAIYILYFIEQKKSSY